MNRALGIQLPSFYLVYPMATYAVVRTRSIHLSRFFVVNRITCSVWLFCNMCQFTHLSAKVFLALRPLWYSQLRHAVILFPFLHSPLDIALTLLIWIQFRVPEHPPIVIAIFLHQSLYPLLLPLALFPRRFSSTIPCRLFQLPNNGVITRPILWNMGESIPFLGLRIFQFV